MYNYFMLIGVVEGYATHNYIKLKVAREFGKGDDHFEVKIFGTWDEMVKENLTMGKRIIIKGRLVQRDDKLEIVAERIIF